MSELLAAFQFLTIFPAVIRRPFTPQELGRSVGFYPLVGLALGGMLFWLMQWFNFLFPEQVSAALILTVWVIFTRALHLDGFLDTCDGLFGSLNQEKRLSIMRDSHVGAFGVVGGVLLLLTKFTAIPFLNNQLGGLLLAPVLGRWTMSFAIILFPYAHQEGLGRDIKEHAQFPQLLLASLIALGTAWFVGQWLGLLAWGLVALFGFLWMRFVSSLIPGLTGDIYGATCEMMELLVLLVFTVEVF